MAFRVLIVDDSPVMRAFIRRVLDISGVETSLVLEAADGQEALNLLEREWVDVILTDISMPNMNGEEFVARLFELDPGQSVAVIVVSTDATASRVEQLYALGVRGYISKPFTPEELRAEVEKATGAGHVA